MGVSRTAMEEIRGAVNQILFHWVTACIEGRHLLDQLDGFVLINGASIGLIARSDRVTGQAQQVADAQGMGAEQVALKTDPIAITACQLPDRLQTGIHQQPTDGQAAHAHHRTAAIGDIQGVDATPQVLGHRQGMGGIGSSRGHHLGGDHHRPLFNGALKRRRQSRFRLSSPLCRIGISDWT